MPAIDVEAEEWKAQDDARILADADTIRKDNTRLKKAINAAKKMAKEETKRTEALRKVAGLKPLKK